jgi:1-pyrroline-5-carboxylate dehydrogenase
MFDPPEELHVRYERALAKLKGELGREHRMLIDGKEVRAQTTFEDTSPINQDWVLGRFQQGGVEHAEQALAAARRAFPAWSGRPWRSGWAWCARRPARSIGDFMRSAR